MPGCIVVHSRDALRRLVTQMKIRLRTTSFPVGHPRLGTKERVECMAGKLTPEQPVWGGDRGDHQGSKKGVGYSEWKCPRWGYERD